MSNKKLAILALLAGVMVVWAVGQSHLVNRPRSQVAALTGLIQGLQTESIGSIVLGKGDDAVTLKRIGDQFVVADKDNYPAKMDKINELLVSCLDIKVSQLATENPANHEALEVTEAKARNVVKFLDDKQELIAGVIIGKRLEAGRGSYVRRLLKDQAARNQVYVADSAPWLQMSALTYVDKLLTEIERDDIAEVTVTTPQETYHIVGDPNGPVLQDIPAGQQPKGMVYTQTFEALGRLEFADVQKQSDQTADFKFDHTFICRLKDSTVYTFKLARQDDKIYTTCSAAFTDAGKVTMQRGVKESEEELKKKEAKLLAQEAANTFNARHAGWVYELANWQGDKLTKPLAELIEDIEAEQPAESQ